MFQLTLSSPAISCGHCIATIERAVGEVPGARFLRGDPATRQFAVALDGGAVLDALAARLAAEGYPLGDAPAAAGDALPGDAPAPAGDALAVVPRGPWRPQYRLTSTAVGADVNYACPCSCEAGFAFDRAREELAPESCCCGRRMLVGVDAEARLRSALDPTPGYDLDVQVLTMPWGQPLQAALAIPRDGGEHGRG
ncbi:MAG: copper chaperone [Dehalococcoidia bacterium]|nr:copper chaperone [Dehalococcoidia bacterium]